VLEEGSHRTMVGRAAAETLQTAQGLESLDPAAALLHSTASYYIIVVFSLEKRRLLRPVYGVAAAKAAIEPVRLGETLVPGNMGARPEFCKGRGDT